VHPGALTQVEYEIVHEGPTFARADHLDAQKYVEF
jgi:hypothetical protein